MKQLPEDKIFFLFDDDCGICTTGSHFLVRLIRKEVYLVPMHLSPVEQEGLEKIGDVYWKSFHIVKNNKWTTEGEAIIELAKLLPFGSMLSKIAKFPLINRLLLFFLSQMQQRRQAECELDL